MWISICDFDSNYNRYKGEILVEFCFLFVVFYNLRLIVFLLIMIFVLKLLNMVGM